MISTLLKSSATKRIGQACKLSSASIESPRITVARNILLLKNISEAADEESLKKVLAAPLPTVDISNLPDDLKAFQTYLDLTKMSDSEKFIPDPTAWQNMNFLDMAVTEVQREETWPFFVGFLSVFLIMGFALTKLPEEGKKTSKYMQLLEGKHDDGHSADAGHHH